MLSVKWSTPWFLQYVAISYLIGCRSEYLPVIVVCWYGRSGFTTPNWIYLGGQGFSWRPKLNRQGKYNFLGGDSRQPRNIYSLAVLLGCQGNDGFTWRFHWAAKKTVHFLGGFFGSPRKKCIYLAVGSQGNNWYMHIILIFT